MSLSVLIPQNWTVPYNAGTKPMAVKTTKLWPLMARAMCNAIDEQGHQAHIMSAIGHQTKSCHTQKKSALCQ